MGSKNQTTKSVCLNHNNEEDKKILRHVSRRNFSGYVKKLILADINNSLEKKRTTQEPKPERQKPETHEKQVDNVQKQTNHSRSASAQGRSHGAVSSTPLMKINQS